MACTLTVPFWPTSYDNLHWSKDNQLAVVGGEHILFLTPRLKEPTPSRLWWDTENLVRVNAFTEAELHRSAVLTDRNTSVGEEISIFQAHAAAWSNPGLARYGGSGLAVLTSNHVLSLWALESDAKRTPVWQRTVVVNHAIRKFYGEQNNLQGDERENEETLQIQQRVRSFAWTQPVYDDLERPHPDLFSGQHYLVVATEGGHILVIRLTSPYSSPHNPLWTWQASVTDSLFITYAKLLDGAEGSDGVQLHQPRTAMPAASDCDYIGAEHIAVGGWKSGRSDGQHAAPLVFVLDSRLYSTGLLHDSNGDVSFACGVRPSISRHLHDREDLTGPLKMTPGIDAGALVVFGTDTVFHGQLVFDGHMKAVSADFQHHHLDDRWDDPSGATIIDSGNGDTLLQIVSQLSSSTAPTYALRLPLHPGQTAADQPAWHFALNNSKVAFGATKDLGDHVQERTWGIASSPISGYTATCASMHPNDVVAYIINAEQTSVLNVTPELNVSINPFQRRHGVLEIHGGLPTSTILFYLMRYLERAGAETLLANDAGALVKSVQSMLSSGNAVGSTEIQPADNTDIMLCKTRISMFADEDVHHAQATRICDVAADNKALRPNSTITIVRQVAEVVFSLSDSVVKLNEICMNIRRMYEIALSKLDTSYNLGDCEPSAKTWSEKCKICHQSIAFESFKWARCQQGHQFARCALSLLAIQEPGTTKDCSVCGLHYLDETIVEDFEPVNQDSHMVDGLNGAMEIDQNGSASDVRSKTTMASLLFKACHVCLYCGGKFKD